MHFLILFLERESYLLMLRDIFLNILRCYKDTHADCFPPRTAKHQVLDVTCKILLFDV